MIIEQFINMYFMIIEVMLNICPLMKICDI